MSHEFDSGVFTNGEGAWHGLGLVLPEKCWQTEEAIRQAGMDWTVYKTPIYIKAPQSTAPTVDNNDPDDLDGLSVNVDELIESVYEDLEPDSTNVEELIEIPHRKAIVRSDNNTILGVCSNRYEPLQNVDAFSFFDIFLHEKECFITSAISLAGGRKIAITAQIEDNIREIVPGDTVESYLILATSHDGSLKTLVKYSNTRPVCMNTLKAAEAGAGSFKTVRHTATQMEKLSEIQNSINLYKASFEEDVRVYKQMAAKEMSLDDTRLYLERLFSKELEQSKKRTGEDQSVDENRLTRKCLDNFLFTEDLQLPGVQGTAWAAFNAVTEMIKTKSSNREKRMESIWFGPDSALLERAKNLVLSV